MPKLALVDFRDSSVGGLLADLLVRKRGICYAIDEASWAISFSSIRWGQNVALGHRQYYIFCGVCLARQSRSRKCQLRQCNRDNL